jgi:hypothetical protein
MLLKRFNEFFNSVLKEYDILNEAKISSKNLEKAVSIFNKLLAKKLSTKFYRFGGPNGYSAISNGIGLLFFYDGKKAIRYNYIDGEIQSITLWDNFKLGSKGNKTIDLGNIGLLQSAYKLLDIFGQGVPGGSFMVTAEIGVKESKTLFEAKRIKPDAFIELVKKNLPGGISINSVPFGVMSDIAHSNGYLVPSSIQGLKVPGTKGYNARYNFGGDQEPDLKAKGFQDMAAISVHSGDSNTSTDISPNQDKTAKRLTSQIDHAVKNPDKEAERKDPNTLFGLMAGLVKVIARKARNSLIIYGSPGTGKTFEVTKTLNDEGLQEDKDYFFVKGKITPAALYKLLYMHREGDIIVLDDTDSVWGDKEAANILKAALDSYDKRVISWESTRTAPVTKMSKLELEMYMRELDGELQENPETKKKLPSKFPYEGRIIFISNLTGDEFDSAVLSRSAKIDMTLTTEQILLRIEKLLPFLGDKNVPLNVKKEIFEYLKTEVVERRIEYPNMRTFVAAIDLYKSGLPNWKELLEFV